MRVVLEILSGFGVGRKALLGAGQILRVGRTEWADLSVPKDGHMSGVHFALESDQNGCYVEDLGSSNGTLLNGRPLAVRTALQNGDQITAGKTTFAVQIEGAPAGDTILREGDSPDSPKRRDAAAVAVPAGRAQGATYTAERCDSGLTLCRGETDQIQPEGVATLLAQAYQPYLIVDLRKLGIPLPEELESPDYLFDFLEPAVAAAVSPVVVSQQDYPAWPRLIEEGWGEDAVVCLFSMQEKTPVLEHLRRSLRPHQHGADGSRTMLGYCWPSVMAPLLSHFTPEGVERLLTGIEAVLVELPDLPITWQVYGGEQVATVLEECGFIRQSSPGTQDNEQANEPDET
jgi:pSer/pThr/pTyr-binding forkhead associated (FHA) protein